MPMDVTRLRESVNEQFSHIVNTFGILQDVAALTKLQRSKKSEETHNINDYSLFLAQIGAEQAQDTEYQIDTLPASESWMEMQNQRIDRLKVENYEAARNLREFLNEGELMLHKIQSALKDISESLLNMQLTEEKEECLQY